MKKNKIIVIVYKLTIVLASLFFVLTFLLPFLMTAIGIDDSTVIMSGIWLCFGLFMVAGVAVLVIPFVANKHDGEVINEIFSHKKDITKIEIEAYKFDELLFKLNNSLDGVGYRKTSYYHEKHFQLHLYCKSTFKGNSNIFAILYSHELTEETFKMYELLIVDYLNQNNTGFFDSTNVIELFCVDRLSTCFQKIINSGVEQDFNISRFCSGISFGGRKLYVAPPKNRFAASKYNKSKKMFMKCMDFLIHP